LLTIVKKHNENIMKTAVKTQTAVLYIYLQK